jgi:hypothetical protein
VEQPVVRSEKARAQQRQESRECQQEDKGETGDQANPAGRKVQYGAPILA